MHSRKRRIVLAMTVMLGGGMVLQLGSCAAGIANLGLAAVNFCTLIGTPDCSIGPFAPCGVPDIRYVDVNGIEVGNPNPNARLDDLLIDCPVIPVPVPPGFGGGT